MCEKYPMYALYTVSPAEWELVETMIDWLAVCYTVYLLSIAKN